MNIYHYDPETGVFLDRDQAEPDPRGKRDASSPDHWLIPANATHVAPPEIKDNQEAVWNGQGWGTRNIPTPPAPPPEPTLPERKAAMVARIKAEAYQRIEDIMPIWTVIRSLTGGPALSDAVKTEAQRLRQVSNTLESQVNAMNAETLNTFDPGDDTHWQNAG